MGDVREGVLYKKGSINSFPSLFWSGVWRAHSALYEHYFTATLRVPASDHDHPWLQHQR